MKNKSFFSSFVSTILLICFILTPFESYAHSEILNVTYDNCGGNESTQDSDAIDEMWYTLNRDSTIRHLSHEEVTIKYYFSDWSIEGENTWTDAFSPGITEEEATELKTSFANSMQKWNNVYFYSYDDTGNIIKNKIINIVEGSYNDHNLIIYPTSADIVIAATACLENETIETTPQNHIHGSYWMMQVCVVNFFENDILSSNDIAIIRASTGAHEVGHILGLTDIDSNCSSNFTNYHHSEVLMGYADPIELRSPNITYKDIAGVAITRGFHTDNDHEWLNCGLQENGTYKLLCSICNGVKLVTSLNGYSYNTYQECSGNHELSSNNMMAVASYGNMDYYKCKYCKYVAPFDSNIAQNYSISQHTPTAHIYTNTSEGLSYTVLEPHDFVDNICTICGYTYHQHFATLYRYLDNSSHRGICSCGEAVIESHAVRRSEIVNGRYAPCIGCKRTLDLTINNAFIVLGLSQQVSANGSVILPNGIIILVDEDLEAYMNGTLLFYYIGKEDSQI